MNNDKIIIMPTITKLKSQKNHKIINVFIDNKFAFGLSLDQVVKKGLSVGQEYTEKELEKLFFQSLYEKLYAKTLNFLSYRPRSEKEIKTYLKKNYPKSYAIAGQLGQKLEEKILKQLKQFKLLNDFKFASWWIEQRLAFKPKGKRVLRSELFQKGIKREIIDSVLSTINNEQSAILAQKIVAKKIKLYQNLPKLKLKQKLFSHLGRRGFDYNIIKKVIDESVK